MGRTESPIEAQFLAAWERLVPHLHLETQYRVDSTPYRLDFAYLPAKIAIELDGYEYHSDRDQFTHGGR